jgi:hypothetical protein
MGRLLVAAPTDPDDTWSGDPTVIGPTDDGHEIVPGPTVRARW